jgi:hypothetical protein
VTTVYTADTTVRGIESKKVTDFDQYPPVTTLVYRTTLSNGTVLNLDSILHIDQPVTITVTTEA